MYLLPKALFIATVLGARTNTHDNPAESVIITAGDAINATQWDAALAKANNLIAQISLTEKASIVTGTANGSCIGNIAPIERVGFGGLCLSDGPQGLHLADLASVFPSGLTAAATWDRVLIGRRGQAMGAEFRGKGANVMLGPSAGPLGRSPWGGRNWEGFSPDPYLSGVAMQETIRSAQAVGVQACAKHYIGNEQETHRTNSEINGVDVAGVSANIDDRTLHELYLWPFADAVKAGVASMMCSYNRVNLTYSCENSSLLKKILRDELGFQGYVMSDFFATHSGPFAINAGLDLNMPGYLSETDFTHSYFGTNVVSGIRNGTIPEWRLNEMLRRILTPYYYFSQDHEYPTIDPSSYAVTAATYGILPAGEATPAGRDVRGNHSLLIREIGSAGTVLLKNVNKTLPIRSAAVIGVFGNDAPDVTGGLLYPNNNYGSEIGTLVVGGGSGSGRSSYIISPLEAIKARARDEGSRVVYLTDNNLIAEGNFNSIYPRPDICLVFLKTWAQEGIDRQSLEADWNSTLVVNNVASICPRTVVITHTGGVNIMPWADNENVTAILAAHYPGQESGNSITDILWGNVNPSGKLPYTIARDSSDYNTPILNLSGPAAARSDAWQVNFTEGLMIDYRHFDAHNIAPLYEFGYGLSYTTFDIVSNVSVQYTDAAKRGISALSTPASHNTSHAGGNPDLWADLLHVTTTVSNTGDVSGATVVQLYLSYPRDSMPPGTPVRVLRGFEKVTLEPAQQENIHFSLRRRDLSFWDTVHQNWRIPEGQLQLSVGFSSRDLRSSTLVKLT